MAWAANTLQSVLVVGFMCLMTRMYLGIHECLGLSLCQIVKFMRAFTFCGSGFRFRFRYICTDLKVQGLKSPATKKRLFHGHLRINIQRNINCNSNANKKRVCT